MWSEPTQPFAPATPAVSAPVAPAGRRTPPRWAAILLFCLLAGLIPETIATTSTSVLKILADPFSLIFVAFFYGTADLVIREAIIRRRVGLAGKLLLGVAFGFFNEGVVAGTWYRVRPPGYAFIAGVDWNWAVALTIFHTLVSVLAPIYLFDSVMPSLADVSLLRRRGITITVGLFLAVSFALALTPLYRAQRLIVFGVALLVALLALALPHLQTAMRPSSSAKPSPGVWRLRALGFLAMLLYFLAIYALPSIFAAFLRWAGAPAAWAGITPNLVLLALTAWVVALGIDWTRRPDWSARRQLALITGALFCSALITLTQSAVTLEPLATVPFMLFLIILAWRARRAESVAQTSRATVGDGGPAGEMRGSAPPA